jgi:hypothetical protein
MIAVVRVVPELGERGFRRPGEGAHEVRFLLAPVEKVDEVLDLRHLFRRQLTELLSSGFRAAMPIVPTSVATLGVTECSGETRLGMKGQLAGFAVPAPG